MPKIYVCIYVLSLVSFPDKEKTGALRQLKNLGSMSGVATMGSRVKRIARWAAK